MPVRCNSLWQKLSSTNDQIGILQKYVSRDGDIDVENRFNEKETDSKYLSNDQRQSSFKHKHSTNTLV